MTKLSAIVNQDEWLNAFIDLCLYLEDEVAASGPEALPQAQQDAWYLVRLIKAMDNGGYTFWLSHKDADYATQTLAALENVGARQHADTFRQVAEVFPEQKIPPSLDIRETWLQDHVDEHQARFRKANRAFYEDNENLMELSVNHVRESLTH